MADLSLRHCVPCHHGTPRLDEASAESLLRDLPGWTIVDRHHLSKTWTFPDFRRALDFVNRVGAVAEAAGHHPDIELGWGRVQLAIWTHAIDGLSESDFILAARAERCAEAAAPPP